jgi:predicted AlkP superfamily pyrophosphatase or phosphodiesterase
MVNMFTTPFKQYCGQPLTQVVEGRLNSDLSYFDRIIVVLIDGLAGRQFFNSANNFYKKIQPEMDIGTTVFPSMTVTATTSLFTGVFPFLHGLITDKFYDCDQEELKYVMPRSTENARIKYPFSLPITAYSIDPITDGNYKVSLVSAGILHSTRAGSNFISDFFGEEFSITGDYIEEKSNRMAFERARQLLKKYKKSRSNFVLFVRLSVDWLTHKFGVGSAEANAEGEEIFNFITLLSDESGMLWPDKRTLFILTSDHGQKDVEAGLISLNEVKTMIKDKYQYIVSNQSVLHLYHEWYRALVLKSSAEPIAAYVRKEGRRYFAYDIDKKKWTKVTTFSPNEIPTFSLSSERFGTGYHVGEFAIIADNFYFTTQVESKYPRGYSTLKGIHGGLSPQETLIPLTFWRS